MILSFKGGESNFPVERGKNLTRATLITKGWGMAIIQGVKYKKNIFSIQLPKENT